MENLLDIYTKLKLKTGSEIEITYYTKNGSKHTIYAKLIDIIYFSHIRIASNEHDTTIIPFFSPETIIESIRFKKEKHPIYLNHYVKNLQPTNPFDKYDTLEKQIQEHINCDQDKLKARKRKIKDFLGKTTEFEYDDLFFSAKQKEDFEEFLIILISELKEYAKSNGLNDNFEHLYTAKTSIVYAIGDKIIKIGKPRRTPTIPYCEFLLQPIINRTLEFDGYPIHLEVTQKVYTFDNSNGYEDVDDNEQCKKIMSELAAKLESIGLAFNDMLPSNFGILLKDNKIHYPQIPFDTADEQVTSIENNNNKRILPKGTPIILDLDCIEIVDIKKYTKYLRSIGLNKTEIHGSKRNR